MKTTAALTVVDTNVFAYALLGVPEYREEALRVLDHCREIWAPASLRAELVNTVWQWVRFSGVSPSRGHEVLRDAEALVDHFVPTQDLWAQALDLAIEHGHPAYDTLFVALVQYTDSCLVTYDQKLIDRFPAEVSNPTSFLST